MNKKIENNQFKLEPSDNNRLLSLCGPFDENIKLIERRLGVEINYRGNNFNIVGQSNTFPAVKKILKKIICRYCSSEKQISYY